MRTTPDISGPSSSDSFAFYDPASSSLKTCQVTLLSDSTESSVTLPKRGSMRNGWLYEHPTWAPRTDGSGSSSLLPTPNASDGPNGGPNRRDGKGAPYLSGIGHLLPTPNGYESTPTPEYVEEMREAGIQPDERLYLPGRKWHAQRTLSRIAPALLPTPVVTDSFGSRRATARTEEWESNPGTTLTDAIWLAQGRTTDTTGKLLPTPEQALSGAATSPPSADGRSSSDDSPLRQLTIEDA